VAAAVAAAAVAVAADEVGGQVSSSSL